MLTCLIFTWLVNWENCEPPTIRPAMHELLQAYTPNPDCVNRDRHIRYLISLKGKEVLPQDDIIEYDSVIDSYVARLQYYCR